jgi:ferredoxin-NADP reductase
MDGGQVARYTDRDTPFDLPIITDLYTPSDTWREDEALQGLPSWFLSTLIGTTPTFTMLHWGFKALPQDNWEYMAEINHYRAINEWWQSLSTQVDQLLIELETLHMEQQLCQGRLEMGCTAQQAMHLCLGQHGAH